MLPIPELQKNKFQKIEGWGQILYLEFSHKKSFQKNRGMGGGSILSGQVPDRNEKSILMAFLLPKLVLANNRFRLNLILAEIVPTNSYI